MPPPALIFYVLLLIYFLFTASVAFLFFNFYCNAEKHFDNHLLHCTYISFRHGLKLNPKCPLGDFFKTPPPPSPPPPKKNTMPFSCPENSSNVYLNPLKMPVKISLPHPSPPKNKQKITTSHIGGYDVFESSTV